MPPVKTLVCGFGTGFHLVASSEGCRKTAEESPFSNYKQKVEEENAFLVCNVVVFVFLYFFIFPLNKYEYNIFNKISTVKKK